MRALLVRGGAVDVWIGRSIAAKSSPPRERLSSARRRLFLLRPAV
jgi:hypothetical protein